MIIVKLNGGLGNQMFQYAFGTALAAKENVQLLFDTSTYNNNKHRNLNLLDFNTKIKSIEKKDISDFFSIKTRLISRILQENSFHNHHTHFEKSNYFYDITYQLGKKNYYSGYWQSEKYFKAISEVIIEEFTLKNEIPNKKDLSFIENEESIALHIRRGDYVTDKNVNDYHGVLPESYYIESSFYINSMIQGGEFIVFTDDPKWVKEYFNFPFKYKLFDQSIYSDSQTLFIMSLCKHQIIANSTFSWWAAWLNKNKHKTVISPKKWFNKAEKSKDLIPETWIEL